MHHLTWAYGVAVSISGFHRRDLCSYPGRVVNFDIANLYIKSALRQ